MAEYSGMKHSWTGQSAGMLYTDRRDFYLNPYVYKDLYPDVTPFVSFVSGLRTVRTQDPDFIVFEHRGKWLHMNGYMRSAVDWDSGGSWNKTAGSLSVATEAGGSTMVPYLVSGDIIEVRAGSAGTRNKGDGTSGSVAQNDVIAICHVTVSGSNVTLNALDIDNDGSNTYDIAADDPFVIITHADAEASNSPDAWSDELEKVYNSCQIIKTVVKISETLANMTKLRGSSNELARLREEKAKEHKMKVNRAALLGVRIGGYDSAPTNHLTDTDGEQIRTTQGVIPLIKKYGRANEQYFQRSWSTYDASSFIDDMEAASQYDNAKIEKFAFAGSSVLAELAKTGESSFFARSGGSIALSEWKSTSFGFDIRTLTHPFGQLHITWDPSLRYGKYKNMMVVVDPDNVERVIYRPDTYQTGLAENDGDYLKEQFFSDSGIALTLVEKHFLMEMS